MDFLRFGKLVSGVIGGSKGGAGFQNPFMDRYLNMNPWKTKECPLKRDDLNRKCTFQRLIFKGHVSFSRSFTSHSQLLFHHEGWDLLTIFERSEHPIGFIDFPHPGRGGISLNEIPIATPHDGTRWWFQFFVQFSPRIPGE